MRGTAFRWPPFSAPPWRSAIDADGAVRVARSGSIRPAADDASPATSNGDLVKPMSALALVASRTVVAALIAVGSGGGASAAGAAIGGLRIANAWTRPAALGANAAGYLTITNRGSASDSLILVTTPAAARASIHVSRMVGQVMTMRGLASLPIPAAGSVTLRPGGLHVMFEGLTSPLKAGQSIPAILTFARAGPVRVAFRVSPGPPMGAMPGMTR